MPTFISTATVPQSFVVNRREAAAINLAVRHISERAAKHIMARQVAGRLVWKVQSQTSDDIYTVTLTNDGWEADTCNCPDHVYRGTVCKHIRAAELLSTPAPAPQPVESRGPNWNDAAAWDSPDNWTPARTPVTPRKVRRERIEEDL